MAYWMHEWSARMGVVSFSIGQQKRVLVGGIHFFSQTRRVSELKPTSSPLDDHHQQITVTYSPFLF